jgi:hypothetical protein
MPVTDVSNTKKILTYMNVNGGGASGPGVWVATLAAALPNPVFKTLRNILDDAVAAGYATVLVKTTNHNDERDNFYQVTASGITFANS